MFKVVSAEVIDDSGAYFVRMENGKVMIDARGVRIELPIGAWKELTRIIGQ